MVCDASHQRIQEIHTQWRPGGFVTNLTDWDAASELVSCRRRGSPQTPALQARRQRTSPGIFFFGCHPSYCAAPASSIPFVLHYRLMRSRLCWCSACSASRRYSSASCRTRA